MQLSHSIINGATRFISPSRQKGHFSYINIASFFIFPVATRTYPSFQADLVHLGFAVDALKAFVEKGGTVVLLNQVCTLAFNEYDVPARNALQNVDRTKFFCPTSILKILVDNETPIGYGMPREAGACT